MWSVITECVKYLFYGMLPPPVPTDLEDKEYMQKYQEKVAKWRKGIVNVHWVQILAIGLLIIFVFGVLLPEEINRVAWAQDTKGEVERQLKPIDERVKSVEKTQSDMKEQVGRVETMAVATLSLQLRDELRETRRLQCLAIQHGDAERRAMYGKAIDDLREQYETIRGKPWVRPGCDEV